MKLQRKGRGRLVCLLILVSASVALSGCVDTAQDNELSPLVFTKIEIIQNQMRSNAPDGYTGSLFIPHCVWNLNDQRVLARYGHAVYHVRFIGDLETLHPVGEKSTPEARPVGRKTGIYMPFYYYDIFAQDVIEGASNRYALHFWHEIVSVDPPLREDRWYNVTFTPYGPRETLVEDGNDCDP